MMIDSLNESERLGTFFVTAVTMEMGRLIININSDISSVISIVFTKQEAFQVFHESDYHELAKDYKMDRLVPAVDTDCGIFVVQRSPYFNVFLDMDGRYLDAHPFCYLIATPDERIEVISFEEPTLIKGSV